MCGAPLLGLCNSGKWGIIASEIQVDADEASFYTPEWQAAGSEVREQGRPS